MIHSSDPLVSVVIPTHNRGHLLPETLDTVFAQTYPRLEIVIVDDGSTDATEQVVARYGDRVTYVRHANQGLGASRNAGVLRSHGDLIAWLDDDDLWQPEKVALQVAVMQAHPELAVIASDLSAFDVRGVFADSYLRACYSIIDRTPGGLPGLFEHRELFKTAGCPHVPPSVPEAVVVYHGPLYRRLIHGNCLHPPTVMFRREAAERAGAQDGAFGQATDYEYLLRLSREGDAAIIDLPLIKYRCSPDQMSSDRHLAQIKRDLLKTLERVAERDPSLLNDPAFRRRFAQTLVGAAHANADVQRLQSARNLVRSLASGYVEWGSAKTAAKLVTPRFILERVRKLRATS